jgi:hypothetical protein
VSRHHAAKKADSRAFIDTAMTDSYPFGHELPAPNEANYRPDPTQGSGSCLSSPQLEGACS